MRKQKRVTIFFDLDGVLYPWNEDASFEDTFVPGYFNSDRKQENAIECVKKLKNAGYDVCFLTAVYTEGTAIKDKQLWLEKNGLGDINCIFVPFGDDKYKYVDNSNINILIDDFTKNLKSWASNPNYYGIKFFNDVNTKNGYGSWSGFSVHYQMSGEELFVAISGIADNIKFLIGGNLLCS